MKKEVRRLDYGDRKKIQDMLDARERLVDIAREVMADPTSVSRETRRNRTSLGKAACGSFREFSCRATERFPHVCNGCRLLNRCPKERWPRSQMG